MSLESSVSHMGPTEIKQLGCFFVVSFCVHKVSPVVFESFEDYACFRPNLNETGICHVNLYVLAT